MPKYYKTQGTQKRRKTQKYREDERAKALCKFMAYKYSDVLFFHVANERKTAVRQKKDGTWYSPEGAKLKAMGVLKGVPDYLFICPNERYVGMAMELKTVYSDGTKTYASQEQKAILKRFELNGWYTCICHTTDQIMDEIDRYMKTRILKRDL